ncbi:MAG: PilN domain-containing protein, partial [Patescibacteria group bacterium]
ELIVIGSFLTRFSLDRQVTDLNEEIFQKQIIIESYGPLENDVRALQKKIDEYKQVEQKENLSNVFPTLQSLTPRGILYDELKISARKIELLGSASSQNSFSIFANNLQLSPKLGQVSINRISSDNEKSNNHGVFEFDVKIIKPAQENKKQE